MRAVAAGSASNWPRVSASAPGIGQARRGTGLVLEGGGGRGGAIQRIRAEDHGTAELGRFERIVTTDRAGGSERAGDQHHRRETIEQPEFAQRIDQIEPGRRIERLAGRMAAHAQPCCGQGRGDLLGAGRVARRQARVSKFGKRTCRRRCASATSILTRPHGVEAASQTGLIADQRPVPRQLRLRGRGHTGRRFQIADGIGGAAAPPAESGDRPGPHPAPAPGRNSRRAAP